MRLLPVPLVARNLPAACVIDWLHQASSDIRLGFSPSKGCLSGISQESHVIGPVSALLSEDVISLDSQCDLRSFRFSRSWERMKTEGVTV